MYTHTHIHTHMYTRIHTHTNMYLYIHINIYVCMIYICTVVNACSRQASVSGTCPFSSCSTWRFRYSSLKNQNGNNEVPLFLHVEPHVPYSSQHPRPFGRYSIVLNRFTLSVEVFLETTCSHFSLSLSLSPSPSLCLPLAIYKYIHIYISIYVYMYI
jgi:hypothetical protein